MSSVQSNIRKIALVGVFIGDAILLASLYVAATITKGTPISIGLFTFFWVFVGITLIVIAGEIISNILTGKTLSTNTTKALEEFKKVRIWIYLFLFGLGFAIASLIVHLAVW